MESRCDCLYIFLEMTTVLLSPGLSVSLLSLLASIFSLYAAYCPAASPNASSTSKAPPACAQTPTTQSSRLHAATVARDAADVLEELLEDLLVLVPLGVAFQTAISKASMWWMERMSKAEQLNDFQKSQLWMQPRGRRFQWHRSMPPCLSLFTRLT